MSPRSYSSQLYGYGLSCALDGLSTVDRRARRQKKLSELGLMANGNNTFFEEATQTVAQSLGLPICIVGLMVQDEIHITSAVGICSLGVNDALVVSRRLQRNEAYCTMVVDSAMPLVVNDALAEPFFIQGELYQRYGIRSYLGTPLLTRDGVCLGTLAVLDFSSHDFTEQNVALLNMTARWCMGEIEHQAYLSANQGQLGHSSPNFGLNPIAIGRDDVFSSNGNNLNKLHRPGRSDHSPEAVKLQLVPHYLIRTQRDLTAVIGMASVVRDGVFGELNEKQKQYLEIIHQSGQRVSQAIEEIIELEQIKPDRQGLKIVNINLALLGEYWRDKMATILGQNRLALNLSLESGLKYWPLDKIKIRQGVYYLLLSLLDEGVTDGTLRIHASAGQEYLHLAVWVDSPQGQGLPHVTLQDLLTEGEAHQAEVNIQLTLEHLALKLQGHNQESQGHYCQQILALTLSFYFIKSHQGQIALQGSAERGYCYWVQWPKISAPTAVNHSESNLLPLILPLTQPRSQ
ncbi:GAF domain-containing protein [Synechocystis sp. FACHB-383]|uniref:sensor histidine kinase n=1 Tax=Synechocystis sp. FACHB-383 TaxID=2692864 RepID=UPI0016835229|nr:GAF domain-containing protein [Synechocystis sp. FACHB-383]MBD2654267.1 GAF domain-containing protein [Synechocystis sp. FACHB-383]